MEITKNVVQNHPMPEDFSDWVTPDDSKMI